MLEAFRNIENDNTYLMLVGREETDKNIDNNIFNWSKNNNKVIYSGQTNIVEQYLSAMDVYILPSYREGFGTGVIEAEAMGLPVIVSNIPGPTDAMIDGETGIIVKKADVDTLIVAMKKVFSDREFCDRCGKNGIEFVKNNFEQKKLFSYILEDRKKLLGLSNGS